MKSPFKFLSSFEQKDKHLFFGRESETLALYELVKKNRLILIYGQSGTGKTSLVHCGLSNQFDATDWYPLFIRRQNNIIDALQQAIEESLKAYHFDHNYAEALEEIYAEYLRPVYLIFDQLEELLILGSYQEQKTFIDIIARLLEAHLPCKIIFILREEYLAHLYHFEKAIPSLFDRRLRVEPMSLENIRRVIRQSCQQCKITFENAEEAPDQIIENISNTRSGTALPYLQVYLDMLYRKGLLEAYRAANIPKALVPLKFSEQQINDLGKIDNVLEKFLEEQQERIQEQLQNQFPQTASNLVSTILDDFVAEGNTKRPVPYTIEGKYIMVSEKAFPALALLAPNLRTTCIQELEKSRILSDNENTLELAHDSLAALIDKQRTAEQRQLHQAKKRLNNAYFEYKASKLLMNRNQLSDLKNSLNQLRSSLDKSLLAFIEVSEKNVQDLEQAELTTERRKRKKARQIALFGISLSIVALLALWIALKRSNQLQIANTQITLQLFDTQIQTAKTLKIEGKYSEALQQLMEAKQYFPFLDKGRIIECTDLQNNWQAAKVLLQKADSLYQLEQFHEALLKYRAAFEVSPDAPIKKQIQQTSEELSKKYEQYISAGELRENAREYEMAKESYLKALSLRPADRGGRIQQKLAALKNKHGIE